VTDCVKNMCVLLCKLGPVRNEKRLDKSFVYRLLSNGSLLKECFVRSDVFFEWR
jgi:hypothetical protein